MLKPRDPNVVAIIQARMGSSRLPGKVLKEIGGVPMLFREILRTRRAQSLGQVVVATTTDECDDSIARFCTVNGFPYSRGDPYDVLDRYYQAACLFDARVIVRLTGDCPLIDPFEIDRTVCAFYKSGADFAANRLPPPWERTTPIGMDTEVVSFGALERAWQEAEEPYAREHVMPYFYEEEDRFDVALVDHEPNLGHLRLTVDTAEDLDLVRRIYDLFGNTDDFSLKDVLVLFEQYPELLTINAKVEHKSYTDIDQGRS